MKGVFYGSPKPMYSNYEKEKKFIHAICRCSTPQMCIKIPRIFSNNGVYSFHCVLCETEGVVIANKRDLGNGEKKGEVVV